MILKIPEAIYKITDKACAKYSSEVPDVASTNVVDSSKTEYKKSLKFLNLLEKSLNLDNKVRYVCVSFNVKFIHRLAPHHWVHHLEFFYIREYKIW